MKNLILADLKVLGHRIWSIPLGVFLFIFSFSFIPYLDQVQSFQNWIFILLIPGLLLYENLRENSRNNLLSIHSLPVKPIIYVLEKYVFLFLSIGISMLAASLFDLSLDILNLRIETIDFAYDIKIGGSFWYPTIILLWISLFLIPLYFRTKNINKSIILSIIISIVQPIVYGDLLYNYRYTTYYYKGIIYLSIIIIILYFMIKLFAKYSNSNIDNYDSFGRSLILVFPIVFSLLFSIYNKYKFYFKYGKKIEGKEIIGTSLEDYYISISDFNEIIIVASILIMIFIILILWSVYKSINRANIGNFFLMTAPYYILIIQDRFRDYIYIRYYHSKIEIIKNISRYSEQLLAICTLTLVCTLSIYLSKKYLNESKVKE